MLRALGRLRIRWFLRSDRGVDGLMGKLCGMCRVCICSKAVGLLYIIANSSAYPLSPANTWQ